MRSPLFNIGNLKSLFNGRLPGQLVIEGVNGCLNENLREAALKALHISPDSCRQFALSYSWDTCSRQFIDNLIVNKHQFC